jgi:outer membrane protein assembly factor BamB
MLRTLFLGVAPATVFGWSYPTLTLGPDDVLYSDHMESLYAINGDGSTKWIFDADEIMGPHAEGLNGTVYATTPGTYNEQLATLFALDSSDGSIKWKYQLAENRTNRITSEGEQPLVVGADGTVYLTSRDRMSDPYHHDFRVDAIDAKGALKWTYAVADGIGRGPSAVGVDGTVFVRSRQSLDALRPDTGTVRWSLELEGSEQLKVIAEDGDVFVLHGDVFAASSKPVLSRLSNEDGGILWKIPLSACQELQWQFVRSMTLGRNQELYVNGLAENGTCSLGAFDFKGNALRSLPCFSSFAHHEPHYGNEEDMFVTVTSVNVLAHSGADGRLLWNVSVPDRFPQTDAARFGQHGTVFVWTDSRFNNVAHAHAIRNGEVAWSVQTGGASQQIMSKDGTTYVQGFVSCQKGHDCSDPLEIVAVGADGVEKWRYTPTEAAVELV